MQVLGRNRDSYPLTGPVVAISESGGAGYSFTGNDPTTDELVDNAGNFLVDDADNNLVAAA